MSRSMHYFRKYSGPILAVFGVILMITWVAGPFLESLFMGGGGPQPGPGGDGGDNPVVVTWTGGSLRQSDLEQMRYEHNVAVSFVRGIVAQTLQNGGQPQAPGLEVGQGGQIFSLPIPMDDGDASLMQIMLLADKARRQGVAIDNASVKDFLHRLSAYTMQEGDWLDIARRAIGERSNFTVNQLFERLQTELLAQHMRNMDLSGFTALTSGGEIMPITPPPGELWDYFLRLHRRATIEAVPFEVSKYVKEVKDPTRADETELRALFEKGRDRDPNPALPEPGFYRPQKAAFEYFRVDFQPFLEEAKKQITEEQIKEAYDKDISQGLHKELELPPEENTPPASDAKTPEGDAPPAEAPGTDDDKAPPADDARTPPPSDNPPPGDNPPADNPSNSPADEKSDAKDGNVRLNTVGSAQVQFVSTQNENAADGKSAGEPDSAPPPAENDAPPSDQKPAAERDEAKPAEGDTSEPPATEPPATDKPASEKEAPAKFRPLSEVREQILNRLAQPIAEDARREALNKLVAAVKDYGRSYRRYQTAVENKSKTAKDPGKFDPKAVASSVRGVTAESTPLINRYQAGEYQIGQNGTMMNWQTGQTFGFGDAAFGPDELLYDPKYIQSRERDVLYIFWRTQEEKPATPTFEEAREDVIKAWKQQKAFEIAERAAADFAKKNEKAESFKAVAPAVTITPQPFSWLDLGSLPFGRSRAELSQVNGIPLAGQEFMQGVFSLNEGSAGTAPNQPHTTVYAVRVAKFEPPADELRERFAESGLFETMMVASGQWQESVLEQLRGLSDEYNVAWQRPPQQGRQFQ
jgi:hypothetical protein